VLRQARPAGAAQMAGAANATGQRGVSSILDAGVQEQQAQMAAGKLSSKSLVQQYLARIAAIDKAGPRINAVIELNPDAVAIAEQLDRERKAGKLRGPLHGIPVLIKDNIATADKMSTTAGSLALAGVRASKDAFVAQKLREAGAVILGKTNLSEWANMRSTHSVSGWSGRGGQTRNPYALDRNTSGSSSGSGAAMAAGLATLAIGTETDGSIVSPASTCGIVGIKPTLGLVSRSGIIPIAHSQDTAGPMTRSVADAALLLGAIAGVDAAGRRHPRRPGQGGRLCGGAAHGWPARQAHRRGPQLLRQQPGHRRRDREGAGDPEGAGRDPGRRAGAERRQVRRQRARSPAGRVPPGPGGLAGRLRAACAGQDHGRLIAFNEKNGSRELQHFGQEHLVAAQKKPGLDDKAYRDALANNHRYSREEGIDKILKDEKLDALVAPTGGTAWLTDYINGDHYGGSFSSPAAVAGYPHVTVPAGYVAGLPVGISFVGTAWTEASLIGMAYAYEQASLRRRAPAFPATVNVKA
jgi:amidase